MFWNNSRTFYNLYSKALGSFGFLPLRGAGTGFVVVLPLSLFFDPPLYILHFTIYTTFHREATLKTVLELLDYSVNNNTRVYQIHKKGGVANRFLTARRHFWTPWSERTHCMKNGQSVFFLSPHTRVKLARFARVRLLRHALPISLLILRKKPTVLQSKVRFTLRAGMVKVSNQGLDDRYIRLRSHRISNPVVSGLRQAHSITFSRPGFRD